MAKFKKKKKERINLNLDETTHQNNYDIHPNVSGNAFPGNKLELFEDKNTVKEMLAEWRGEVTTYYTIFTF